MKRTDCTLSAHHAVGLDGCWWELLRALSSVSSLWVAMCTCLRLPTLSYSLTLVGLLKCQKDVNEDVTGRGTLTVTEMNTAPEGTGGFLSVWVFKATLLQRALLSAMPLPPWVTMRREGLLWPCRECGPKAAVTLLRSTWGCMPTMPCVGLGLSVVSPCQMVPASPTPTRRGWEQCGTMSPVSVLLGTRPWPCEGWEGGVVATHGAQDLLSTKCGGGAAAGGPLCCLWKFTPLTVRAIPAGL